jgi:predicted nucleotidyltransferase
VGIITVLNALQGAVGQHGRWAIIGAVARNAWAPPRATTDLDLAVVAEHATLVAIGGTLESLGYSRVREQRAEPGDSLPDIVIFRAEATELRQVDVLVAKTAFEEDVLRRAETVTVEELRLPVASPEGLVVYKLLADRPRDREDIRAILRTQIRTARSFDWSYVERWSEFWQIRDRLDRLRAEFQPT